DVLQPAGVGRALGQGGVHLVEGERPGLLAPLDERLEQVVGRLFHPNPSRTQVGPPGLRRPGTGGTVVASNPVFPVGGAAAANRPRPAPSTALAAGGAILSPPGRPTRSPTTVPAP